MSGRTSAPVAVDWSAIDWNDADADDPRRWTKGYRSWLYYAAPRIARDGKTYSMREFCAPTRRDAERIIAASPEGRGTITYWSERTHRRLLVADVTS